MVTSPAYSWDRLRQTFADQFEQDGIDFVYRRSQKGVAIRVSAEERRKYIEDFDRSISRAKWIIYIGLTLVLGGIIGFSLLRGSDLSQAAIFIGVGVALVPYFAYYRWAWAAPTRDLGSRTPIAGERSPDDLRRLGFQRISYGQLAGAAFTGVMIPFIGSSRQDLLSGWNRLWLVFGGGLVLLAVVQAFRKWRFEQEDSYRNVISPRSDRNIAVPGQDSTQSTTNRLWRYLPIVVILLGLAFIADTSTGKQLAKQPSFWPILMIGLGGWSLFTAVRGLSKGQIEPFARGFYNTYQRETQPGRFWASMTWNAAFGCLCLWLAFTISRAAPARALQDRCDDKSGTYLPEEALSACNELIKLQPKDSDAYVDRGLIFLNNMKLDQAVTDFTRAHELDPASPWSLADRGISYAWKNDRTRAERDFAAVKKIDPANPVVLHGEAILSMNAGDLETAIDALTTALKINSTDTWSLQTRAAAYQQRGDFEQARADRDRLQQLASKANTPAP